MEKMPRYPTYRYSGFEWIGDMPSHWKLERIGNVFSERKEKVSDKEFSPLSVTMRGIVPQLETVAMTNDGDNRKKVCKGDFVINSRSDRRGSSGLSSMDGSVSLICTVLEPEKIYPKSVVTGKAIKTIFVDGEDLVLVLEGHLSFSQMLDRKVKAAQTKGLIYVHPISGVVKG